MHGGIFEAEVLYGAAALKLFAQVTVMNGVLEPKFVLECIAVKEGHIIRNLKRRYFRLVADSSDSSKRSLLLFYGSGKEKATKVVNLVGAKIADRTDPLGNFTAEHICDISLDKLHNKHISFVVCFDSPSVCLEWRTCIHAFNSADSSAADTRDYLLLIQDGLDAGKVPTRPLVALRNMCVRNSAFRSAVVSNVSNMATVIALLPNEDADIQLNAISIVAACCDSPNRTQALQSAGALKALLQCVQTPCGADTSDGRNSEAALQAIAQMCSVSSWCQDIIKEAAGLKLFLKVMSLMKSKRQDSFLLKRMVSPAQSDCVIACTRHTFQACSKFPVPYANTVIKYGTVCKEGRLRCSDVLVCACCVHANFAARKSLKNRYFELKVGENFEPLLTVCKSQEDFEQGRFKYRLNLTGGTRLQ